MTVRDVKRMLDKQGVSHAGVTEKDELLELIPQPPIALDRLLSEGCLDQLHVIVDRFEDLCLVKRGDTPDCCVVRLVCGDSRCGDGRGRGRRWALRTFLASGVSTPCVRRSMMTA